MFIESCDLHVQRVARTSLQITVVESLVLRVRIDLTVDAICRIRLLACNHRDVEVYLGATIVERQPVHLEICAVPSRVARLAVGGITPRQVVPIQGSDGSGVACDLALADVGYKVKAQTINVTIVKRTLDPRVNVITRLAAKH